MIQLDLSQYDDLDLLTTGRGLYLNEAAALWEHVEAHLDVDHSEVQSFTWRNEYLTPNEISWNNRSLQLGGHLMYSASTHLNAVRLANNDVVAIPSIQKPTIPDDATVTVREVG